jgi:pimeloyl-ACP methyl ester carboxylesterase
MPIFDSANARLYYQVSGDTGPAVVFLNGWTASCREWVPLVRKLNKTHRCLVYDMRGCGRSLAINWAAGFEIDDAIADLQDLLNFVGFRDAHLVGHGVGALVAALAARMHPQDFSTLTLIGTEFTPTGDGEAAERRDNTELMLTQARVLLQEMATVPYLRNLVLWRYRRVPEPHRTELFEDFAIADPRASYIFMQSARDPLVRDRFWDALEMLSIPILLMRGESDDVCPVNVHRLMFNRIRRGQSGTVRGAGHLPMLEYPAECAELLIDFFGTETPKLGRGRR